jgi:hypothetical protein
MVDFFAVFGGIAGEGLGIGKHDPAKLEKAARLRRETTLSVKQIATRLHLGTPKSASVRLLTATRQKACGDPAQRSPGI